MGAGIADLYVAHQGSPPKLCFQDFSGLTEKELEVVLEVMKNRFDEVEPGAFQFTVKRYSDYSKLEWVTRQSAGQDEPWWSDVRQAAVGLRGEVSRLRARLNHGPVLLSCVVDEVGREELLLRLGKVDCGPWKPSPFPPNKLLSDKAADVAAFPDLAGIMSAEKEEPTPPPEVKPAAAPRRKRGEELWREAKAVMLDLLDKGEIPTSLRAAHRLLKPQGYTLQTVRRAVEGSVRLWDHFPDRRNTQRPTPLEATELKGELSATLWRKFKRLPPEGRGGVKEKWNNGDYQAAIELLMTLVSNPDAGSTGDFPFREYADQDQRAADQDQHEADHCD